MSSRLPSDQDPATPFVDRLEHQLRAASARNVEAAGEAATPAGVSSAPWGRRLALAACVLLVGVGLAFWTTSSPPVVADVFEFERRAGSVEVSVVDVVGKRDDVVAELEAAGFDASVVEVAVSPSLVGRLVGVSADGGDIEFSAGDDVAVDSFVIDTSDGAAGLLVEVGRAAVDDEVYTYANEPELCERISALRTAASIQEALGFDTVRWFHVDGTAVDQKTTEQLAGLEVVALDVVPEHAAAAIVFVTTDSDERACQR